MKTGEILRIVMTFGGVLILMETVMSLSKRRLKEQFCLFWGVISVLLIVAGIFLRPIVWSRYVSRTGTIIIIIAAVCVVCCLFYFSIYISVLSRKTQELAMQVSLLNQENERMFIELDRLQELLEKACAEGGNDEKKDPVCD